MGDYDDYSDYYSDNSYSDEPFFQQLSNNFQSCAVASFQQILSIIGILLGWTLLFRLATQTVFRGHISKHCTSFVCGFGALYYVIQFKCIHIMVLTVCGYFVLWLLCRLCIKFSGWWMVAFCLAWLAVWELIEPDIPAIEQIRGVQMVVAMKLISVAFDMQALKLAKLPAPFEAMGYIFCPANAVLGPWVSYTDYLGTFNKSAWAGKWIAQVIYNTVLALSFMILSNCFISNVIPDMLGKWFTAFRDAMSFRTSHYFVSFLSQATQVAAGFIITPPDTTRLGYKVVRVLDIEVPRSVVKVVVAWNLPMHNFLKTYIFRSLKPHGVFRAILGTYLVSSLLHGLNASMAAVLLSLGVYTFIEFKLRQRLAVVFNACTLAVECKSGCSQHAFRANSLYVRLVNGLFTVLAITQLAYLGVCFETSASESTNELSFGRTIRKWGALNYFGHWITAVMFFFYILTQT